MYAHIKNSLLALTVAASIVGFGYAVGEPIPALAASPAAVGMTAPVAVVAAQPANAATPAVPRRSQGLKRHLAMPFFSFSPLSRRGA